MMERAKPKTDEKKFDYAALEGKVTASFLKENDGKLAWIRDDYLMCMGYVYHSDRPYYDFLERVEQVKKQARESGITFSA